MQSFDNASFCEYCWMLWKQPGQELIPKNRKRAIKTASKKILSKDGWAMQSMIDYAISQKV